MARPRTICKRDRDHASCRVMPGRNCSTAISPSLVFMEVALTSFCSIGFYRMMGGQNDVSANQNPDATFSIIRSDSCE